MSIASPWYRCWCMVAVRATRRCRRHGWVMLRAGNYYYLAAVPGMMAPVADTAGKGDCQDSEDDC